MVSTRRPCLWITVSHPGISEDSTIGDIIRLKTLRRAIELEGYCVRMITAGDACDLTLLSQPKNETHGRRRLKEHLKTFVPSLVWSTLKDLSYLRLNRLFLRILRAEGEPLPDAIIDYNFYLNDAALRFARGRGIPIYLNCETLIPDSMPATQRSLLRHFGERFERRKYQNVDRILAVSEPLAQRLREITTAKGPPIDVIPNAVEIPNTLDSGNFRSVLAPNGEIVVGFVGGLSDWYSLDRLIEACAGIRQRFSGFRLVIVGDGPERGTLETQIQRLNADGWCILTGKISHDEISRYLTCFDIGVITNHKWWTSPLKLLEYGAHGAAVVAPRIESISSMVSGDEVVLFEPGDLAMFSKRIEGLLFDRCSRKSLGEALKRRVQAEYGMDSMRRRLRDAGVFTAGGATSTA